MGERKKNQGHEKRDIFCCACTHTCTDNHMIFHHPRLWCGRGREDSHMHQPHKICKSTVLIQASAAPRPHAENYNEILFAG